MALGVRSDSPSGIRGQRHEFIRCHMHPRMGRNQLDSLSLYAFGLVGCSKFICGMRDAVSV